MKTDTRIDPAHDINYPQTADSRGSARINHSRSSHYFGPYESPVSHIAFGIWKHRLLKTGVAPPTKELRSLAESLLNSEQSEKRSKWASVVRALVFASACLLCGLLGGKISSTMNSPLVDGIPLSASETDFIRGRRVERKFYTDFRDSMPLSEEIELTAALSEGRVDRDAILERIRGY